MGGFNTTSGNEPDGITLDLDSNSNIRIAPDKQNILTFVDEVVGDTLTDNMLRILVLNAENSLINLDYDNAVLVPDGSNNLDINTDAYHSLNGVLTDATGNGYTLTNSNATINVDGGIHGDSYTFNGTNAVMTSSIGVTAFPFVLFGWFKTSGVASASGRVVIDSIRKTGVTGTDQRWAEVRMDTNGKVYLSTRPNTSNVNDALSTDSYDDGDYHFYCAVWESATSRKLYIDGELITTGTSSAIFSGLNLRSLGANSINGSDYFTGDLSECGIQDGSIDSIEQNFLYQRGVGTSYPYWINVSDLTFTTVQTYARDNSGSTVTITNVDESETQSITLETNVDVTVTTPYKIKYTGTNTGLVVFLW